ncbi:MAG: ECF transporter S component [Erysipelotrichales bacterium]|nr:ECF transporter S component [Erysipelotrichales bacterium]
MRDKRVRDLVFLAVFSSIIILMSFVPFLGFLPIPFLGAPITLIPIPVVIGAIFLKRQYAWVLGLVFGLCSLAVSYLMGATPFDELFRNPLVSVLPRVIFAILAYEYFQLFSKTGLAKKATYAISSALAVFSHTILVIIPLIFFGQRKIYEDLPVIPSGSYLVAMLIGVLVVAMIEWVVTPLVATPALIALDSAQSDYQEQI